jgi:type I restriction enzyme R subunit
MKSGAAQRILFLVDRRALAAQAVRTFAAFEPEPARKFDKIYEVYSQRFQKEDFDANEKFDPKVLPRQYLESPGPGFRIRLHHSAHGDQFIWPPGRVRV